MAIKPWHVITGWRRVELFIYAVGLILTFTSVGRRSSRRWMKVCQVNRRCRRFLHPGWLGDQIDTGDNQWRELRESLPLLFSVLVAHCFLSLWVRASCPDDGLQKVVQPPTTSLAGGNDPGRTNTAATKGISNQWPTASRKLDIHGSSKAVHMNPPANPVAIPMGELGRRRVLFDLAVSMIFLVVIHGAHAIFPISLACASFLVGHAVKGMRAGPAVTWTVAVGLVWVKEYMHSAMTFGSLVGVPWGFLDRYTGMYPWRLSFNLVLLRLVSFNMDLHWAWLGISSIDPNREKEGGDIARDEKRRSGELEPGRGACQHEDIYSYTSRVTAHRPPMDYSLWNCLAYTFYTPLYVAGPTITFNAFISQMAAPQKTYSVGRLFTYVLRLGLALLLLEKGTHLFPVFAIARSDVFRNFSPSDLSAFVYIVLKLMWLKFLVIWRFFRLWALCDGVDPPENMQRCMSNNYSIANFWKGWHCRQEEQMPLVLEIIFGGAASAGAQNSGTCQTPITGVLLNKTFLTLSNDFGFECAPQSPNLTKINKHVLQEALHFNRWLVRYIYIPLGGSKPGHWWNVFVVFIFVALWHDMEAKLVAWGLLNGIFFVIEAGVRTSYKRSHVMGRFRKKPYLNRMIQGLGAATYIMVLMMVNLIGYTVGIQGTTLLAEKIFLASDGQLSLACSFAVLYGGSQIMFAIEEVRLAERGGPNMGMDDSKAGKK